MILIFLSTLCHYVIQILPILLFGFLISGIIHEFMPQTWVDRYLNKKGIKAILCASLAGAVLPLCCLASLPVAIGFTKKGVRLGPVLAFLVATPSTSITAVLVAWRFMGGGFTLYLCFSVMLISFVTGIIGNLLHFKKKCRLDICPMCGKSKHTDSCRKKNAGNRIISALSFGFVDIVREIGLELLAGLIIAAAVVSIAPLGNLITRYLYGGFGYLFAIVFGIAIYFCPTASVPLVHALVSQGLSTGAGLTLLIVGPVTNYGAILVMRKEFGFRVLGIYLSIICALALILGYVLTLF